MSLGKNPGGCSRLSAKTFAGALANTIRYKPNKVNGYFRRRREFGEKEEEKS